MPTPAQKREQARQRKANQRARDKGMPEPYAEPSEEALADLSLREGQHFDDLAWATQQDETGTFYKSECRSLVTLLGVYEGNNDLSKEDEEIVDKKTGKKKNTAPNPSVKKIQIRATETADPGTTLTILIEPDEFQYRNVYEVDEVVSFRRWLDLRDKARKNLLWLGRLLGKNLYHASHQQICDMFVAKNFDDMYFPGYHADDLHAMMAKQTRTAIDGHTPTREMLLMAPRSGYKSTIDGIDSVQWLLNCPDVRIMIITAFRRLANTFAQEIKKYFYLPSRGEPTMFHLLFPEYVLTGIDGRSKEPMECPAHNLNQKEPNLWVTSMESSATGMRCDIRKADDIVDPKNSNSDELREKLKFEFNGTDDLLEPWGFSDVIGTRYFTNDWYGTRMLPDEDGNVAPYAYLCLGSWRVKSGYAEVPLRQLTEDMVILWFPQKLSWKYLRNALTKKGERSFLNQQMNVATDPLEDSNFTVHFDEGMLRSHTYALAAAPQDGEIIVAIDWAYSDKTTSDYSVLVAARIHRRDDGTFELIILEIQFDKWKSSELALQIVLFLRKWMPKKTIIEKANAADLLQGYISAIARKYGCEHVLASVSWMTPSNKPDAKRNRIKNLELLLNDDRLHIVSGAWIEETYKQLTRFTGEIKSGRKDDIPDAMGYAALCLPASTLLMSKLDADEQRRLREKEEADAKFKANYDRYFGETNRPQARTWREYLGVQSPEPAPVTETESEKPRNSRFSILPPGMRA